MSKDVVFLGDTREVLRGFPDETRVSMGHALHVAQEGGKVQYAKPLKGIGGGATVIEICDDHDGDTYRVMYPSRSAAKYTSCTLFRRSQRKEKRPQNQKLTSLRSVSRERKSWQASNFSLKRQLLKPHRGNY